MTGSKRSTQHRMIVVRYRPVLTWTLRISAAVLSLACTFLAYRLGIYLGTVEYQHLVRELADISGKYQQLQTQHDAISQAYTNMEMGSIVDRTATETVRQEMLTLKDELQKAREENHFYKSIMQPQKGGAGPDITDWEVTENDGQYQFQLILKQLAKHTQVIKGKVTLSFEGVQDGEATTVSFSNVTTSGTKLPVKFRYFQTLNGSFFLPDGFKPETVIATLTVQGKKPKKVTKHFVW